MTDMDKKEIEKLSPSNIEIVLAILNSIQIVQMCQVKTEMETRT